MKISGESVRMAVPRAVSTGSLFGNPMAVVESSCVAPRLWESFLRAVRSLTHLCDETPAAPHCFLMVFIARPPVIHMQMRVMILCGKRCSFRVVSPPFRLQLQSSETRIEIVTFCCLGY